MNVKIEFMGSLRRPNNIDRITKFNIPENCTLKELFIILEYSSEEILRLQAFLKDGSRLTLKDILHENDSLFITIPIGGG